VRQLAALLSRRSFFTHPKRLVAKVLMASLVVVVVVVVVVVAVAVVGAVVDFVI